MKDEKGLKEAKQITNSRKFHCYSLEKEDICICKNFNGFWKELIYFCRQKIKTNVCTVICLNHIKKMEKEE